MSRPQITADFRVNAAGANKEIKDVDKRFKSLGDSMAKSMRRGLKVGGGVALAGLTASIAASIKAGIGQGFKLETSEVAMKSLLGSLDKAREAMAMIHQEALENPIFSKSELADSSRALAAFAENDVAKLKQMVELSQRLYTLKPEAGLMGAAEALRDALGGETERLKEYAFSGKQLTQMKEQGGDPMKALSRALDNMGVTAQTLKDFNNTVPAQLAGIRNQLTDTGQEIGNVLIPEIVPHLESLNTWMETNRNDIVAGLQTVTDATREIVVAVGNIGSGWDKATQKVADWWFDPKYRGDMMDHATAGVGQVVDMAGGMSFRDAANLANSRIHGAQLGERSRMFEQLSEAKRAAQLGPRAIQISMRMQAGSSGAIPKPMTHS